MIIEQLQSDGAEGCVSQSTLNSPAMVRAACFRHTSAQQEGGVLFETRLDKGGDQ